MKEKTSVSLTRRLYYSILQVNLSSFNHRLHLWKILFLLIRDTKMASKSRSSVFEDLSNVEFETSEDVEVIDKFSRMNLREELTRGIYAYGMYLCYY